MDSMDEADINTFEAPSKKLKLDWEGFWRSKEGNRQRRFKAKCMYCLKQFIGTIPNLRDHKALCDRMPSLVRKKISTAGAIDNRRAILGSGDEPEAVAGHSRSTQEDLDGLLCKAIVASDVPFR